MPKSTPRLPSLMLMSQPCDIPLLKTSDYDTMSEGSLATVVDKSRPQSFDHASKSPDATPEAKPRPWEQKMYPCLKTHRYDRGTKL